MYVFILVIFLQSAPIPIVGFLSNHDTKASCMAAAQEMRERVVENSQMDVKQADDRILCVQMVRQSMVKDI
jgi:hypothetical protein